MALLVNTKWLFGRGGLQGIRLLRSIPPPHLEIASSWWQFVFLGAACDHNQLLLQATNGHNQVLSHTTNGQNQLPTHVASCQNTLVAPAASHLICQASNDQNHQLPQVAHDQNHLMTYRIRAFMKTVYGCDQSFRIRRYWLLSSPSFLPIVFNRYFRLCSIFCM